jgi:glycosyltransferase involved in cell wall biosynthesis
MNKLKVAWICNFSNPEIRQFLPLSRRKKYADFAPWITNLVKEFEKRVDVELHVIAPHKGLQKIIFHFENNAVHYHFFNPDLPIVHRNWPSFYPVHRWTKYFKNRILLNLFIKQIEPDIINLHGAENDYYSISVLDIKKIPVFVCIQGIYSNPKRFINQEKPIKFIIRVERKILKTCKYFGIFSPFFIDLIKRDNNNPIFLRQSYIPDTQVKVPASIEKKYDFVFWGRITEVKGIDKIIEAIALIKKQGRITSLLIIGHCPKSYYGYLNKTIEELQVRENIAFIGYLPTIQEVHRKALEARVTVISSRFDNIPGTIIESVLLGIPVAATNVGGIPFLNRDGKTILLSEYGDIEGLAKNMLKLLDNIEYANRLTKKCREFILREFRGDIIVDRYIHQYHAIIAHYKYDTPIPRELLFDKVTFNKKLQWLQ